MLNSASARLIFQIVVCDAYDACGACGAGQVLDQTAITNSVLDEMQKCYPEAKEAHVKDGGNFPYLSRDQEVNMYLKIHLRQFEKTRWVTEHCLPICRQLLTVHVWCALFVPVHVRLPLPPKRKWDIHRGLLLRAACCCVLRAVA